MDVASTSTIRRAMRKVEDVILLQGNKACRLACQADYFIANSTSYAITFESVDSDDTFYLQSGMSATCP
ncbi:MAG: hypothetical protein QOF46_943 [Paraburkholderia sp.]|nr:hypothetical protein [Paraburkholderia sp.]